MKRIIIRALFRAMFVALASILAASTVLANDVFFFTGSMSTERYNHTATLLANGKVLVAGGFKNLECFQPAGYCLGGVLASAEIYDPSTGTFTAMGNLTEPRMVHDATLLQNGKVLVTGGYANSSTVGGMVSLVPLTSAELYDPTTGTFTATGSMNSTGETAILLPGGKVLVIGDASAELYDPATGAFTLTDSPLIFHSNRHTATLLNSGQVLLAGGYPYNFNIPGTSAELYDPVTGTFSATGSMGVGHSGQTSTLLANGKVLVAAGGHLNYSYGSICELYDPAKGAFSFTGGMSASRQECTATLLPNGSVLLAGGNSSFAITSRTELYDPATGTFSLFSSMNTARRIHTATLLQNGEVLIAGGLDSYALASAEILKPNSPPTANAGPNQTVSVDYPCQASVTLNGSGSSDPDGDPLAYT